MLRLDKGKRTRRLECGRETEECERPADAVIRVAPQRPDGGSLGRELSNNYSPDSDGGVGGRSRMSAGEAEAREG